MFIAQPAVPTLSEDYHSVGVAVGMALTGHPPHRSRRALLMHRAPASGDDAKAVQGIRMMDSWRR